MGCSGLGTVTNMLKPSKGVEVNTELVVGDKEESNEVRVGDNQQAGVIENIQQAPLHLILLMILGWVMPSPLEMWKGFVRILPWRKRE